MGNVKRNAAKMPEETRNYIAKVKDHYEALTASNV
jgi:hypothetical protein